MDFINLCFADETDRVVSSASIQGTMAFNLLTPPQVRLLLGTRWFDFRPLLAGLSDDERERITGANPARRSDLLRGSVECLLGREPDSECSGAA
jgi:hypothetical protein